jgi:hypothetical protein
MHSLIGQCKFSDFVYVFWMWIRRFRPQDCYVKPYMMYDDRLSKGLPVFDQVGNRVKLNDPDLIKKGIQRELKEDKDYKETFESFKDFKTQP